MATRDLIALGLAAAAIGLVASTYRRPVWQYTPSPGCDAPPEERAELDKILKSTPAELVAESGSSSREIAAGLRMFASLVRTNGKCPNEAAALDRKAQEVEEGPFIPAPQAPPPAASSLTSRLRVMAGQVR